MVQAKGKVLCDERNGAGLADLEKLVALQAQAPAGMLFDVMDRYVLGRFAVPNRLHQKVGGHGGVVRHGVGKAHIVGVQNHNFQFIAA